MERTKRSSQESIRTNDHLRPLSEHIFLHDWSKKEHYNGTPNNSYLYSPTIASHDGRNLDELDIGDENPLRRSQRLSKSVQLEHSKCGIWTLALLFLTIATVTLTAVYSAGTAKALMRDKIFTTSSSNAILVLRVLTELCAVLLAALAIVVVEDLQWALASRPSGVSLLHFIGLDSGTGTWGLLRLFATADWNQKYSSLFRLLVILSIPLPGIILMGDIHIELVFFPQSSFKAAAGLADFNASYALDLSDDAVTALLVNMGNPVWNDRSSVSMAPLPHGEGHCTSADDPDQWTSCSESYLMTGGWTSISPQKDNLTRFPESTAYVVPKTKGYQVEFGAVADVQSLRTNGICHTIGDESGAAYWCSATGNHSGLLFGSAYCPLALQQNNSCLTNLSWAERLQLSTSFFVYRRTATVGYSRSNFSILSIKDLEKPIPYPIQLNEFLLAMSAVLPGFNQTNATSGDNSALGTYAVTALPINDSQVAKALALTTVRRVMSIVVEYLQANWLNGETVWELDEPRPGLPDDMYTSVEIAVPSWQVVASTVSRWVFVAACGTLLLLSITTIFFTARISTHRPNRCGYPTLDFAAVCKNSPQEESLHRTLTELEGKQIKYGVAKKIKHERIVLR